MKRLKKMIVLGVMMMTVFSMSVVVAPQASAASAGDLIKMDGLSSVYYLGADGKRYVFPNESTYFSWYSDFSSVVTISQSELESYPLGANVTVRPGTKLVKITTNPKVYAVTPGGNLLWIPSEEVALALYGANWAQRVIDVPDAFFTNYKESVGQASATAYPAGSLVSFGGADIYYIDTNGQARPIADEAAFAANKFRFDDVINSTLVMPTAGSSITTKEDTLSDTSQGAGGTPLAGTGVSVALAASTAQSATIIANQALASMASFNISASNDGNVTVNTLKVKRTGLSTDSTLSAIYLYDGATRLTDAASVSSAVATWNNIGLVIPAGTTKTLTVKADVSASSNGESVALSIVSASDIATNGAVVSGSFPISGNTMSTSNAVTLASVQVGATTLPSTNVTVDPGTLEYSVWKNTITTSRDVNMSSIRFRMVGSINAGDLQNFNLYVAGVKKSSVVSLGSDNYVTFNLETPVLVKSGNAIDLRADLVNGSSRNFSFSLRETSDIVLVDSEYNVNVRVNSGVPATSAIVTLASGTLSITKESLASNDVVKDATSVTLGKFTVKSFGESIKIETLKVSATSSRAAITELRNGALFANGSQIGSTADLTVSGTTFNLGSSLIVAPGTPVVLEVRADIYDGDATPTDFVNNDTILVSLVAGSSNAQGQQSFTLLSTTARDSDTVTVKVGSLSVSKNTSYGDQSTAKGVAEFKVGSFILQAGSAESVTVSSLDVTVAGTQSLSNVTNLRVSESTTVKSSVGTTNSFPVNFELAKNSQKIVDVFADLASDSVVSSTTIVSLAVVAQTASGEDASVTVTPGQTTTIANSALTVAVGADTPKADNVLGLTSVEVGQFDFEATVEDYTITEIKVKASTTLAARSVTGLELKVDGAKVGSTASYVGGIATFTGLNIIAPKDETVTVSVFANVNKVASGFGDSGDDIKVILDSYKKKSASVASVNVDVELEGNSFIARKGILTIASQTLTNSTLNGGPNDEVLVLKLAATGGDVTLKTLTITPSVTGTMSGATTNVYEGTTLLGTFAASSSAHAVDITDITIKAGAEKIITVKVDTSGLTATTARYTATIAADATLGVSGNIVWSDGEESLINGYLIKNLPITGETLMP